MTERKTKLITSKTSRRFIIHEKEIIMYSAKQKQLMDYENNKQKELTINLDKTFSVNPLTQFFFFLQTKREQSLT